MNASSILATSSSRASRPLRRAFSESSTIWPMEPAELIDVPLNDMMAALGAVMKQRKFVEAIVAPTVPPVIRIRAGMLRKVTGFVPSMIAARNSARERDCRCRLR